jgi:diguanylate cyclase (GGDEF)-like protein/PAS domain S-box-containing protein
MVTKDQGEVDARRAQPTSQADGMAATATAQAGAEAGGGLSSLLGAGPFLEAVIEHIPAVVFVKDATDSRFILLNRAGEEFLGVKREAIIGRTDHDVSPKDEADRFVARDHEVLKSRQVEIFEEEPVHTPHNGLRFLRTRMIVICDDQDQPQYLLGISEDVTDQKLKSERIRHMAHHDGLTDLANRALFRQRLDAAMAEYRCTRRGVVLFFIDLDGFKRLNDTLGHPTGDAVLRLLAERIRRCAHDGDTVARLGGDEFAIIHPVLPTSKSPTAMATELVRSIARPYDVGGSQLTLTASVGVSVAGEDCQDPDRMLKNADVALYRAKTDGRNAFRFYDSSMDNYLEAKRDLERAVRNALARGEFEVHYQPTVDVRSERTCGYEALIRWRHREKGLLPPSEFIGIAEEVGFIVPLGEWVLRKACDDAASWPPYMRLAVNVSPAQCSAALTQTVMNALAASRLPPDRLELEITESALLQDNDVTLATLHQLRKLGVKIAMDDFGTGYSSLSYLRSFPFDKIKIDKSFVKDVLVHPESLVIVRAVAGLGLSFGVPTTAEGVETREQFEQIREAGCTQCQGYLFGRAIPNAEVMRELHQRRQAIRTPGYA